MANRKHKLGFKLLIMLLLPLAVCLLGGCSDDENESESAPTPVKFSLLISSPNMESAVIANSSEGKEIDSRFYSHFNDEASFRVLAKQDGSMIDLGTFEVTKTPDNSSEGRINVDATDKLSSGKPYDIYLIGGSWRWDESGLYYKKTMTRGGGFSTWLKLHSSSIPSKATNNICGTGEILFVINKSGNPIKFKHKGFKADSKWYYSYAEVSVDNGNVVNAENGAEVEGVERNVPVFTGKNASSIYSIYVPNGNKISNAQLIAEIDGKEVYSENSISSDITIQTNHSYAMFAIWDGKKLMMGNDGVRPVVHVCSDENSDFQIESVMDDGTIVFSGNAENMPKVGEIIVSGVTEKAPYGFLYRVEEVINNGGTTTIRTSPATINEAIPNGNYNIKIPANQLKVDYLIDPFGNKKTLSNTRADDDDEATLPFTYKLYWNPYDGKVKNGWLEGWDYKVALGLDITGTIGVGMSFRYVAEEGWLDYIGLIGDFSFEVDATAKIVGSMTYEFADIPITTYWLKPITVMLGYVPVVFTPVIQVKWKNKLTGKLELSCKLFSTKGKHTYSVGYNRLGDPETGENFIYDYDNEPFKLDESYSSPNKYIQELSPKLSLLGEWKSTIRTELNVSLYGANDYVNLGMAADIYTKLKGEFKLTPNDDESKHSESLGVRFGGDFLPVAKMELKNPIDKTKTYGGTWDDLIFNVFDMEVFSLFALVPYFDDFIVYGDISQSYKKDAELRVNDKEIHIRATMTKPDFQLFPDVEFGFCIGTDDKDEETRRKTWHFYNLKEKGTSYFQKTNLKLDLQANDFNNSTKYYVRPYVKLENGNYVYRERGSFTTHGFIGNNGGTIINVPGEDF